jgi:hypothetical protein
VLFRSGRVFRRLDTNVITQRNHAWTTLSFSIEIAIQFRQKSGDK